MAQVKILWLGWPFVLCLYARKCVWSTNLSTFGKFLSGFWAGPWKTQQSCKNILWLHWRLMLRGEVSGSWHACVDTWTGLTSHFLLNFSFNFQYHKEGCFFFLNRWLCEQCGQRHIHLTWTCTRGANGDVFSCPWPALSHLHKIIQVSLLKESWWVFFKIKTIVQPQNEHRAGSGALASGGGAWCNRFRNTGIAWWSKALHQ